VTDHRAELRNWIAETPGSDALQRCAALARAMASAAGLPLDGDSAPSLLAHDHGIDPPLALDLEPSLIGQAYEMSLGAVHRHTMGVHYTPAVTAAALARVAIGERPDPTICDPSAGGGAFLLAAAAVLSANGHTRRQVVEELLWGIDIDPGAVAVAEASLALWASEEHWVWPRHVIVGDALAPGTTDQCPDQGFDVVLGNPPFQNQLQVSTARSVADHDRLRARFGIDAGPYMDTAAWFVALAIELVATDGTVLLLQPESFLVAESAAPVRVHAQQTGSLVGLWTAGSDVFEAAVRVCAPMINVGDGGGGGDLVHRWHGSGVDPLPVAPNPGPETWSPLLAEATGVPSVAVHGPPLSSIASATAGFRDEFYGLAPHTLEAGPKPTAPLVTVGMIDPLRNRWGTGEFRYAGTKWTRPEIDIISLESADASLAAWVRDRRVPKVLVATQTKVIEAFVDVEGVVVPSTPTIAVTCAAHRLWHVAAALSSPVVTALALTRVAGAALSSDTIKLSAKQVLALPLPTEPVAWDAGARLAQEAAEASTPEGWATAVAVLGEVMCDAYGVDNGPALFAWWRDRLPAWR
jgi:hypothetical protein